MIDSRENPVSSKSLLKFLFCLLLVCTACGQVNEGTSPDPLANHSVETTDVALRDLQPTSIEDLALLGKVWGYVKYHHPSVTRGDLDWDKEIIAQMQMVLAAEDSTIVRSTLEGWVTGLELDDVPITTSDTDTTVVKASSSKWMDDRGDISSELAEFLQSLQPTVDEDGAQYYVGYGGAGNASFINEPDYNELGHPDWRYRLLALYRFWNIVEYWFPYRNIIESDWDQVLTDFIPRLYVANDPYSYKLELMALVAMAQDGHANLWSSIQSVPPDGPATAPFAIRFVEERPFVWKQLPVHPDQLENLAEKKLRVGDVVIEVEGEPVEQIIERVSQYYGSSNRAAMLREIGFNLLEGDPGEFDVKVDRDKEILDVIGWRTPLSKIDLTAWLSHDKEGDTFQLLAPGIAYLKLTTIDPEDIGEYIDSMHDVEGLVIDIRGYPNAFVVFELGQHLISEPTPFARVTYPDTENPGTFIWSEPIEIAPRLPTFNKAIVVLVDEFSQSQSEYTAMAFRAAPNSVVIGSQTAGADGDVSKIPLPGGEYAWISGLGVFYPDRTPTQQVGIVPDQTVKPTIKGLLEGRDEVLEAAINHISGDIQDK